MGQRVTSLTDGVEKRDTNKDYQTNGDGESYSVNGNGENRPSDNNDEEEASDQMSAECFTRPKV